MQGDDSKDEGWIAEVQARGLAPLFLTLLDVLEPVGILGAQLLYTAQPTLRLFDQSWGMAADGLARALETPEDRARLRGMLEGEDIAS